MSSFNMLIIDFNKLSKLAIGVSANDCVIRIIENPRFICQTMYNNLKSVLNINDYYQQYSVNIIQNRYIIFFGGKRGCYKKTTIDNILCFDIKYGQWNVLQSKLPKPMCDHKSIIVKIQNKKNKKYYCNQVHFMFKHDHFFICEQELFLSWNIERLIWIDYYDLKKINTVSFAMLCKNLVQEILNFLKI